MMGASLAAVVLSLGLVSVEGPPIGSTPADLRLVDAEGRVQGAWQESRFVVLAFLKADCPVGELYTAELGRLAVSYQPRGVAFVGVVAGGPEASGEVVRLNQSYDLHFPILRDEGARVADQVGATRTPEVVVLDERRAIRYRGRIDDRYAVELRKAEAGARDLVDALEALLDGRAVDHPETQAVGCPIDRPGRALISPQVTYSRDVASILQRRCVECHRPGQVGPFPLQTYPQVVSRVGAIAEAVEDGRMPPWHADPRFGTFANDARLTDREKRLIRDWVANGTPEGDRADLPRPASFPEGWRIPQPDLVVSMLEPYTVPGEGVIDYQTFEVDPGFREPTWVQAAEIRPGNRKVVHHCNVFLKDPNGGQDVDTPGELGSYCLAAMTPGSPPMTLPEGMAKKIPAGWHLVFVVHYSPVGTPQVDRTSIGLVLANPAQVTREVATNLLFDPDLAIPARASAYRVERSRLFEDDVLLLAMFPHMHLRGKSFRYEAIYPDGRQETLLDVPRYDFRWQNRYELTEPKRLPAGTTLRCVAHFDNSDANPANPDPSVVVRTGKQSWEEMFNGYYDIALVDQDPHQPGLSRKSTRTLLRLVGISCLMPAWFLWKRASRRKTERVRTDE